jgi:hypothetical protein
VGALNYKRLPRACGGNWRNEFFVTKALLLTRCVPLPCCPPFFLSLSLARSLRIRALCPTLSPSAVAAEGAAGVAGERSWRAKLPLQQAGMLAKFGEMLGTNDGRPRTAGGTDKGAVEIDLRASYIEARDW